MDSITIREIPPLRAVWAKRGEEVCVPIIGSHRKRVLSGVLNILSGRFLSYVSATFNRHHFQELLRQVSALWRGWHIVLFVDKNSAHTAGSSREVAQELGIELRWLPTATPELNVMDCLWRHVRDDVLANEPTPQLDATVQRALQHLDALPGEDRLRHAGVLSTEFWLRAVRNARPSKNLCVST
jgi:hypothetical protein